ncbi:NAD(P)H-dependent oxidoreductase [Pengzhenrongella sp.]|jgi:NAD(P)H-dependent FMN reductase|uniref:NADPH-dependent FMN reductase n=1 Tax=Pengzhenrongella sp. TaxID=2888820 RepID=UPI002F9410ED
MTRIAIIVGSTRPGRRADAVARWVHDVAALRDDATFELVDLADFDLPLLDEPQPAAFGPHYEHAHTRAWSAAIASFDGYVFVTPEYNHSTSGALKNAIDFLYTEWNDKAAGFVGYGLQGGARAVEHLRLIASELKIADVRAQVALSVFTDFEGVRVTPGVHQAASLETMLDELVAWSDALRVVRAPAVAELSRAASA